MGLKVIGAGVGRTGTTSLCAALETLLGGRCYHMHEVLQRPGDAPIWHSAMNGDAQNWSDFFVDYAAAVDWPAAAVWSELAAAFPQALIILSTRTDAQTWWRSASNTIFPASQDAPAGPWRDMAMAMFGNHFTAEINDEAKSIAAYEAHNKAVRASAPSERLLEWQPELGWEPLCRALAVPVPNEPFPHANTSEVFHERKAEFEARGRER